MSIDRLNDLILCDILQLLPMHFRMLAKCVNVRFRDMVDDMPGFRNCPKAKKSLIYEMEQLWAISCRQYFFSPFPQTTTSVVPNPNKHDTRRAITSADLERMLRTDESLSSPSSELSLESAGTEVYAPPPDFTQAVVNGPIDAQHFVFQTPVNHNTGTYSSSSSESIVSSSGSSSAAASFSSLRNSSPEDVYGADDYRKVRSSVISWIRFVSEQLTLFNETQLIAVDIFDRFIALAHRNMWHNLSTRKRMFDVAAACLSIAGKYINTTFSLFLIRRYHSIDPDTLIDFERMILSNLDWSVPWFHIREAIATAARIYVALIKGPTDDEYLSEDDKSWDTLIPSAIPDDTNHARMLDTLDRVFMLNGLDEFMDTGRIYESTFRDCVDFWVLAGMWTYVERRDMLQRGMLAVGSAILVATIRLLRGQLLAETEDIKHTQYFLAYMSSSGDIEYLANLFQSNIDEWENERRLHIPGKVWPVCRYSFGSF